MRTHDEICLMLGMNIPRDTTCQTPMEKAMLKTWKTCLGVPKKGICWVCGKIIPEEEAIEALDTKIYLKNCISCQLLVDNHIHLIETNKRICMEGWEFECPSLFKNIVNDPDLVSNINWDSYRKVESWEQNRLGLYITGPSGNGKTASIWALHKKLDALGTKPLIIASGRLSMMLSLAAKSMDNREIDRLARVPVLMIDDLGKEKFNETTTTKLFELVNQRYQELLPLIVTTRYKGKKLLERFEVSQDVNLGNDIIRRIGESVKPIGF